MTKQTLRAVLIIIGLVCLLAIVGIGSAAWLFMRSFDVGKADAATASQEFDGIRARFGDTVPLIEFRDEDPVVTRKPPAGATGGRLTTMHVLAWDSEDDDFVRVDLPFWLLRLKSGPIDVMSDMSRTGTGDLGITVDELERHGPTLVLDHQVTRDGSRVLIWTE